MEVGSNYYGFYNQMAQDNGWSRHHLGDRRPVNQVCTLPNDQRDRQDGKTYKNIH